MPWLSNIIELINDTTVQHQFNFSWSAFHASQELEKSNAPR